MASLSSSHVLLAFDNVTEPLLDHPFYSKWAWVGGPAPRAPQRAGRLVHRGEDRRCRASAKRWTNPPHSGNSTAGRHGRECTHPSATPQVLVAADLRPVTLKVGRCPWVQDRCRDYIALLTFEVIGPADRDGLNLPPFRFYETDRCPLIYPNAGSMVSLGRI